MSSPARQQAARRNAQLSTGPRTPEGKAASSRNAVKHNLSGTTFVLLPGEDPVAFEMLARDYRDEWRPRTPHETFLVARMIEARWRLNRIARMEAEMMDAVFCRFGEGQTDEGALVIADTVNPDSMRKLQRYAQDAERSYHRAVHEIRAYRAEAAKQSKMQPLPEDEPKTQNEAKAIASVAPAIVAADTREPVGPVVQPPPPPVFAEHRQPAMC